MAHWKRESKERGCRKRRYSVQMINMDGNLIRDFDNVEQAGQILNLSSRHVSNLCAAETKDQRKGYWLRYGKKSCKGEYILEEKEVPTFYSMYNKKAVRNCLCCARDFESPHITIRICPSCKSHDGYARSFAPRSSSIRPPGHLNHYPTI